MLEAPEMQDTLEVITRFRFGSPVIPCTQIQHVVSDQHGPYDSTTSRSTEDLWRHLGQPARSRRQVTRPLLSCLRNRRLKGAVPCDGLDIQVRRQDDDDLGGDIIVRGVSCQATRGGE
jgi:hypothetical protein